MLFAYLGFLVARGYATDSMTAYVQLQEHEFAMEEHGYTATRHQREVGAKHYRDEYGGRTHGNRG